MRKADLLMRGLPDADAEPARQPRKTLSRAEAVEAPRAAPGATEQAGPSKLHRFGVWARVGLAGALGILMPVWPYTHSCGLKLFLYLGAVCAIPIAGGWAAVFAWKHRRGLAQVLSLIVLVWGLALVARVVLPRTGYAARSATWTCTVPTP